METTRRERHRAATIDEIKQAALVQIAAEGAAALSIRGVARRIGMSPAGLYRYYSGLEALITELITDAYSDLADAVTAASADGTPRQRMRAAMRGYRIWAVEHPNRFLLIFGTPIPGYEAPEGGPTVQANQRTGQVFFDIAAAAWTAGDLRAPGATRAAEPAEAALAANISEGFPPELVGRLLSLWAHFHGIVTLEILNQLDWIYREPVNFYESEIENMLDRLFET